jgi:hypothetical protein
VLEPAAEVDGNADAVGVDGTTPAFNKDDNFGPVVPDARASTPGFACDAVAVSRGRAPLNKGNVLACGVWDVMDADIEVVGPGVAERAVGFFISL